jgi:hypothetical protein
VVIQVLEVLTHRVLLPERWLLNEIDLTEMICGVDR